MKKGLTELVFILDRSGSMGGLEGDTIGGFNGMLGKQKREEGEANVTTVLFDDQIEIVHDRFPISVVKPLTDDDYFVRGSTALLDAVGSTVKKVENIQKRLPEEMRAENIIFVITTDGQENASQEYSASMVKKMIERNQEKGWQFLFLGANMDAVEEADKIGIRKTHAVSYRPTPKGVRLNYEAAGSVLSCMRSDNCSMEEKMLKVPDFLRPIKEHLEEEE
ncbi:MAG: VWA domain-containing protein [Lachnospiraceae bacterium]|nr:VWA domain-containing protein [Lachnospiraceae bacterium]